MNKKYLYALIAILISQTYAEYQIIIPLDPKGFLTVNHFSDQI